MPQRLKTDRKVIGTKQLRKALKANRIAAAYLADDADPMLLRANRGAVRAPPAWKSFMSRSMKELGNPLSDPCRRSVRRASALKKPRFFRSQRNIFDISG